MITKTTKFALKMILVLGVIPCFSAKNTSQNKTVSAAVTHSVISLEDKLKNSFNAILENGKSIDEVIEELKHDYPKLKDFLNAFFEYLNKELVKDPLLFHDKAKAEAKLDVFIKAYIKRKPSIVFQSNNLLILKKVIESYSDNEITCLLSSYTRKVTGDAPSQEVVAVYSQLNNDGDKENNHVSSEIVSK